MSYKPNITFDGSDSERTIGMDGPDAIKRDITELNKMFDPLATHDDESTSPGGIGPENIQQGGVDDNALGNLTPDDNYSTAFTGIGVLSVVLSMISKMIKAITGKANWYTAPTKSIETIVNTTYTKTEVDGQVTNLQNQINTDNTNLSTHKNRVDNPHIVTASQIGVYTAVEVDSIKTNLQGQIDSNDIDIQSLQTQISNNDTDITNLQSDVSTHNHDPIYYRESEVDAFISALKGIGYSDETLKGLKDLITGLQSQIDNLNSTFSTDAERIAAFNDAVSQFEAADNVLQALINNKANISDVYTKTQVDSKAWGTSSVLDRAITSIKVGLAQIKNEHLENKSITSDKLADSLLTSLDDVIINARFEALEQAQYSTPKTTQQSITSFDSDAKDAKVLYEIEGQSGNQITKNGDFANGIAEWGCLYATLTTNNNILNITANGTATRGRASQSLLFPLGHRVFYRAKVKVTSSECTSIQIGNSGWESLTIINNPIQNKIYTIYGAKVTDGNTTLVLDHYYADSTTSNGKIMEVMGGEDGVMCIDMGTDSSHPLYNKTAEEMNAMFPTYFEGVGHSTIDLQTETKNLADLDEIELGGIDSLTGEDTITDYNVRTGFIRLQAIQDYKRSLDANYIVNGTMEFDLNKNFIASLGTPNPINISNNGYVRFRIRRNDSGVISNADLENIKKSFQLEQGTTTTLYQPYKSKTLQPNITLKSVPAISDVLRNAVLVDGKLKALECAEHVKNVSDEAVLNGNENWVYSADLGTVYRMGLGSTEYGTNIKGGPSRLIIDGEEVVMNLDYDLNSEHHYISGATKSLYLFILKSKVDVQTGPTTIEKFKTYLSQYPITLNYQLENPPITKLPNLPELWSYANGRLIDNSPIKPKITYSVAQNDVAQTQGNTEVLQKHEDQIESNMNEIGILKDEITNNINQETITLNNSSPTEHITAEQNGGIDTVFEGELLVNELGSIGGFDKDSNNDGLADGLTITNASSAPSVDTNIKLSGNSSQRVIGNANESFGYSIPTTMINGNTYLIFGSAYIRDFQSSGNTIGFRIFSGETEKRLISFEDHVNPLLNTWIQRGIVYTADGTEDSIVFRSGGSSINLVTTDVNFDNFMQINLTAIGETETDINKLLAKYPYVNGAQPLLNPTVEVCGKNLFNIHGVEAGYNSSGGITHGVTFNIHESKLIGKAESSTGFFASYKCLVKKGLKYTLKLKKSIASYYATMIYEDRLWGTGIETSNITDGVYNTVSFVSSTGTAVIGFYFITATPIATSVILEEIQLELGDTATTYEPYKGGQIIFPTELSKIDTYQDKLTYKDGVAKVDREVKHVVLDGSLDWGDGTDLGTVYRFSVVKPSVDIQDMVNTDMLIINGQRITYLGSYTSDTEHWYANGNLLLYIEKPQIDIQSGATVIEKFKSYLNAFPAEVYYVLQEPIQEEIQPIILGDGVNLVEGQNTVSVKSGIVWEEVEPIINIENTLYFINNITITGAKLSDYKTNNIIKIIREFENIRVDDTDNWTIRKDTPTQGNGGSDAYITKDSFELKEDSSYYVLYEALQEDYNCQVQEIEVSYEGSIRKALNEAVETIANNEKSISDLNIKTEATAIKTTYESNDDTNAFTDAEKTKLAELQVRTPQVIVSTSKALSLTDEATKQKCINTTDITITVQPNSSAAFPINAEITIIQYNVGLVTIAEGTGVTIRSRANKKSISGQYTAVTLTKIATDEWLLVGSLI